MTKYLIVTHVGPCLVSSATHNAIRIRKRNDSSFASQILLTAKMKDFHELGIEILNGKLPEVGDFTGFERKFIMKDPPARSILL